MVSSPANQPAWSRGAVRIRLMGGFGVYHNGLPVILRPSVRRLVALLAITGEADRADVAAQLFSELPGSRAQSNLRTILWRLSDDFSDLVVEQRGYLHVGATAIDYQEVSEWSLAVVQRRADDLILPKHAGKNLLPNWGDTWLIEPREHLHLLQVHALEASAERFLLAGRFGEASDAAMRAAALDPLRESAVRLLIEVLIREGNIAEASMRYRKFAQRLRLEINAEPGVTLRALVAPHLSAVYRNPHGALSPRPKNK
jgi:DNA-binding SARP family transcriptional activator